MLLVTGATGFVGKGLLETLRQKKIACRTVSRRASNVDFAVGDINGLVNLARQAAKTGVKRFVYLNAVKVNRERTEPAKPFHAEGASKPQIPPVASKPEAEGRLRILADKQWIVTRSLQIAISETKSRLGRIPSIGVRQALSETPRSIQVTKAK